MRFKIHLPLIALVIAAAVAACTLPGGSSRLSGTVRDAGGAPIAGAVVRVQTTDRAATTDAKGRFTLTDLTPGRPVTLTAWATGYYIGGGTAFQPGTEPIVITLTAHTAEDNPAYTWLGAFAQAGEEDNCRHCHAADLQERSVGASLPFDEWQRDPHARTASNLRFLTMYTGSDLHGNVSPPTRYGYNRDYGRFPLPPDPNLPYYGPGYKLDFPSTDGNCAACHTPVDAVDDPYGVDPTALDGVAAEGITCDFCHKIWDVRLEPVTGLPSPNMPGVLSFVFRRPPEGHQFFAGPLDDVAPGEDTYVPLYRRSQYCAPCHFGVFWDTVVYNSFGEWLASPYSDPETGQTCQDCHMPSTGATRFARPEKGGLKRDPRTIAGHDMTVTPALLRRAVTLDAQAERRGAEIVVTVRLTNSGAGHHIPTDSPLRHLILTVEASDGQGQPLPLRAGPTVPDWGGAQAGLPGKAFAKVLEEVWTEIAPSGAYWNPTRIVQDTRLPALATDVSTYTFAAPAEGPVRVRVTLRYRRAFQSLMAQKGWDVPDVIPAATLLTVNP